MHLRFTLADEVAGDAAVATCSPPASVYSTTASRTRWDDLAWPALHARALAHAAKGLGAPAPRVRIELVDAELPPEMQLLAACDVQLGARPKASASGNRKVVLGAVGAVRDVPLEFAWSLREL